MIRYLVLSPTAEKRGAFMEELFGSYELSPNGKGEKTGLSLGTGDGLEIIGAGEPSRLCSTAQALVTKNVRINGILFLLSPGDEGSWNESQRLSKWLQETGKNIPVKTWVIGKRKEMDKATSRRILLALIEEHERLLAAVN
ncbi:MAG TPA: hypothetical protein ENH32_04155 [Proteobacteria bacterium]|nr:hypothetical protein [Pseudomonadota bacterium]